MKFLPKLALAVIAVGSGATMFAAASPSSASMGPSDLLAQAGAIKSQMMADFAAVEHLQMLAHREKDVIKLNCINDKLVEMKPELNIADRFETEIQGATDIHDQRASFDSLVQAGDTVHGLRSAAEACAGERLLLTESSNEYTHPDLPDGPMETFGTTIEPPAYASPFN